MQEDQEGKGQSGGGIDLRTRLPSRFLGVTHTDWPGSRMGAEQKAAQVS